MKTIFTKVLYELEKQHDLMLVTLVAESGSAPRGNGAMMLVGSEGRILGTIGGGAIEHRSEAMAMELLKEKRSALQTFQLQNIGPESIGMACGGEVTAYFQRMDSSVPFWKELAEKLCSQISDRTGGWLVQRLDGSLPALYAGDGTSVFGKPVEGVLLPKGCVMGNGWFSAALPIAERAILFGAGHIAAALAPLLETVGFRVTVFDDRAESVTRSAFPTAEALYCGDFTRISDFLSISAEDYLVIMTSGHVHDLEAENQLLRGPYAYIGVIGSRKKTAFVNQKLRELGITEEAIASVHTPIGTAIKAVTPEEIAVSIAGEMIYERALRREKDGAESHGCPMH